MYHQWWFTKSRFNVTPLNLFLVTLCRTVRHCLSPRGGAGDIVSQSGPSGWNFNLGGAGPGVEDREDKLLVKQLSNAICATRAGPNHYGHTTPKQDQAPPKPKIGNLERCSNETYKFAELAKTKIHKECNTNIRCQNVWLVDVFFLYHGGPFW